jgi:hypothetical protein
MSRELRGAGERIATGLMKLSIRTTAMVDHAINRMAAPQPNWMTR